MKKKFTKKSLLNNPVVLSVPIAAALMLSPTDLAYAGADVIEVELENGQKARFDAERMEEDDSYAELVKDALKSAFTSARDITVYDDGSEIWIDFSGNAHAGVSFNDEMLANPQLYVGEADQNPTIY